MKQMLQFFAAYHQAVMKNLAVSMDYSFDGFSSADWNWITIIPGKKFQVSFNTLNGIEWDKFSSPILVSYREENGVTVEEASYHEIEKYSLRNSILGIIDYLK